MFSNSAPNDREQLNWLSLFRRLSSFPAISVKRLVLLVLLSVGSVLAQGMSIGLLLPTVQLLQDPTGPQPSGPLWTLMDWTLATLHIPQQMLPLFVSVFSMVVLAQALQYAHQRLVLKTTEELGGDLRHAAFTNFLNANMEFYHMHREGRLVAALNQETNRAVVAFQSMQDIIARLLTVLLYASVLVLLSWQTALIAVGTLLTVTVAAQYWVQKSRRSGQSISHLHEELQAFAMERLQGVREIKLSNRQNLDGERFGRIARDLARANARFAFHAGQIRAVLEPTVMGVGLAVVYAGSTFFGLSLSELAVFLYALIRVAPEARALNGARYMVIGYMASLQNILELIGSAKRQAEPNSRKSESHTFTGISHGISWENVSFNYEPGSEVIRNLNLSITAGKTTAIVGPSGGGKSTILALLVRLLRPVQGAINIDDLPLDEFDLVSLRRGVALVTQDTTLFNDSVIENIRLARPEASLEEIRRAAHLANADAFIQALPKGYQTVIGDRGATLSVGQRQRVALARALLLDPSVLLLDEVTSAQDADSEKAIHEALLRAQANRTVILVSHRLSFIRAVDRVLVLENGRIVEDGAPQDLLEANGLFRHYHDLQSAGSLSTGKPV